MKKIIAIFLTVLSTLSLISCTGTANKTEVETTPQTEAQQTEKEKTDFEVPPVEGLNYEAYNLDEYITLPDYKSFTLEYSKMTVDDSDVTAYINKLATEKAQKTEIDAAAISGNAVLCSYTGKTSDGTPVGESTDTTVVIGSNTYIPGFEEKLIGTKAGETKEFTVSFPTDYTKNSELAGKDVTFTVSVSKVYKITMPVIDDNFAKGLGYDGVTDMNSFKEYVRSMLQDTADYQNSVYKQSALYSRLMAETTVIKYPENELNIYMSNEDEETAKQHCLSDMITYKLKAIYNLELTKEEFNDTLGYYFEQYGAQYNITDINEFYKQFGSSVAHGQLQQICLERAAQDVK